MNTRWISTGRIKKPVALVAVMVVLLATFTMASGRAQAQNDTDFAATCGDLAVLSIPEGPFAIEAVERLRARSAPNPPPIDAAFDIVVAAADSSTDSPPSADIETALATLNTAYGGVCDSVDRCAFVRTIAGGDNAAGAEAARLLRRIETPSPPGIDAALALIAGDIAESPFHESVDQAREQVLSYYPCGITDIGGGAAAGDGSGADLAFTGTSASELLALFGAALIASGAGVLRVRRRLVAN